MRKFVTPALVASLLVGSLALAKPSLTFDDTGFDYSAREDASTAYVQLQRDGTELRFIFSNQELGGGLPTVTIDEVAEVEGEDMFGEDLLATVENLDEVEVTSRANSDRMIVVNHDDVKLYDTVTSYVSAIEKLGFSVQDNVRTSNIRAFEFEADGAKYRAVFHRNAGDVQVRIIAL